jgi:hypothetical protein
LLGCGGGGEDVKDDAGEFVDAEEAVVDGEGY